MQIEWMFRAMRCRDGKPDPYCRGMLTCHRDTGRGPEYAALVKFSQDGRESYPMKFWSHRDPDDVPDLNEPIEFGDETFVPYGRMSVPDDPDTKVVTTIVPVRARPMVRT